MLICPESMPSAYDAGVGTPAYTRPAADEGKVIITPMMAPYEYVSTVDDTRDNVRGRSFKTTLRFKNNRVYYRKPTQTTIVNVTANY